MAFHKVYTHTETDTHKPKEDNFVELINISLDEYKNTSRKVSLSSPATPRGGEGCTDALRSE